MDNMICVSENVILDFRSTYNTPVFTRETQKGFGQVIIPYEGAWLYSETSQLSDLWQKVAPFANIPIKLYDKRLNSHNFADSSSWANTQSAYKFEADPGKKLIVTYIQVRFPINAALLPTNKLYFKVVLNINGTPTPVIYQAYGSMLELVKKANSPMEIQSNNILTVSTEKISEIIFKYADPHTLKGSPIVIRKDYGEYLEMGLEGNVTVNANDGSSLSDSCWAVVNGKQVLNF